MKTRFPRLWTVAPTLLLLPFLVGSSAVVWWGTASIQQIDHEYEAEREQFEALAAVLYATDKYQDEIEDGDLTKPARIERARNAVYAAFAAAEAKSGAPDAEPEIGALRQRFSLASAHLEASMQHAISSGGNTAVEEVQGEYVHQFKEPLEQTLRNEEQEADASAARSERIGRRARGVASGFMAVAIAVSAGFIFLALRQLRQRKAADDALLASEQRVRTVMETLPDAVVVHRDGQVLFSNPAARVLSPDSSLPTQLLVAAGAAAGEVTIELPGQKARTLDLTARTIDFGGEAAVLVLARDVTERIEMRKRLTHSERLASVVGDPQEARFFGPAS